MKHPMPRPERKHKPAPVKVERPHLMVWAHALRLAGGDVRRIRRLDTTSVLVLNTPL